jgi:hypothetical protein
MSLSRPSDSLLSDVSVDSNIHFQSLEEAAPTTISSSQKKKTAAQLKANALLDQLQVHPQAAASSSASAAPKMDTMDLLTGSNAYAVPHKSAAKTKSLGSIEYVELQSTSTSKKKPKEEKRVSSVFASSSSSHAQPLLGEDHFDHVDNQFKVPYKREDDTTQSSSFCGCFNFFGKSKAKVAKKLAQEEAKDNGYQPPVMGTNSY